MRNSIRIRQHFDLRELRGKMGMACYIIVTGAMDPATAVTKPRHVRGYSQQSMMNFPGVL